MLNTPRDIALESYYIELLGGHQSIHEEKDFYLLGLLIDEATISYEKDRLIITLFRKNIEGHGISLMKEVPWFFVYNGLLIHGMR